MKGPRLPVEVRRDIDDGKLPAAVEPVLLKIMAAVAGMEALSQDVAKQIEQIHREVTQDRHRLVPWRAQIERDVHTAKIDLSSLRGLLKGLRTFMPFDVAANKREDDGLAEIQLRLEELGEDLKRMAPRPAARPRGAPPVPKHFYELGALAVWALEHKGVSRSKAAEAVTACLRPSLPKRGEGKPPYQFSGRLLLKRMAG